MVCEWLANAWTMAGQWLANGWPMAGQWLASGWPMVGQWLANGWPMLGQCLLHHPIRTVNHIMEVDTCNTKVQCLRCRVWLRCRGETFMIVDATAASLFTRTDRPCYFLDFVQRGAHSRVHGSVWKMIAPISLLPASDDDPTSSAGLNSQLQPTAGTSNTHCQYVCCA